MGFPKGRTGRLPPAGSLLLERNFPWEVQQRVWSPRTETVGQGKKFPIFATFGSAKNMHEFGLAGSPGRHDPLTEETSDQTDGGQQGTRFWLVVWVFLSRRVGLWKRMAMVVLCSWG